MRLKLHETENRHTPPTKPWAPEVLRLPPPPFTKHTHTRTHKHSTSPDHSRQKFTSWGPQISSDRETGVRRKHEISTRMAEISNDSMTECGKPPPLLFGKHGITIFQLFPTNVNTHTQTEISTLSGVKRTQTSPTCCRVQFDLQLNCPLIARRATNHSKPWQSAPVEPPPPHPATSNNPPTLGLHIQYTNKTTTPHSGNY